jgi:NitT/TauT family transport system ATP-binding protein
VIRLAEVAKTHESQRGESVEALAPVSLEVRENEFVSLVGPSGCGRSTLLKIVAGLVAPSGGRPRAERDAARELPIGVVVGPVPGLAGLRAG